MGDEQQCLLVPLLSWLSNRNIWGYLFPPGGTFLAGRERLSTFVWGQGMINRRHTYARTDNSFSGSRDVVLARCVVRLSNENPSVGLVPVCVFVFCFERECVYCERCGASVCVVHARRKRHVRGRITISLYPLLSWPSKYSCAGHFVDPSGTFLLERKRLPGFE